MYNITESKSTKLTFKMFIQITFLNDSTQEPKVGKREGADTGRNIHLSRDTIEVKFYHILSTWVVLWLTILILRVNYALIRKRNSEIPTLIFNINY